MESDYASRSSRARTFLTKDERAQQRKDGRDEGVNVDVQAMSRLVVGALDDMEPPN